LIPQAVASRENGSNADCRGTIPTPLWKAKSLHPKGFGQVFQVFPMLYDYGFTSLIKKTLIR
jgi:hypothetical protein